MAALAYACAALGDRKHTGEILNRLREASRTQYVAPYQFAVIYSALGSRQKAVEALDQAYAERSPWPNNLSVDSWKGGRARESSLRARIRPLLEFGGPSRSAATIRTGIGSALRVNKFQLAEPFEPTIRHGREMPPPA